MSGEGPIGLVSVNRSLTGEISDELGLEEGREGSPIETTASGDPNSQSDVINPTLKFNPINIIPFLYIHIFRPF